MHVKRFNRLECAVLSLDGFGAVEPLHQTDTHKGHIGQRTSAPALRCTVVICNAIRAAQQGEQIAPLPAVKRVKGQQGIQRDRLSGNARRGLLADGALAGQGRAQHCSGGHRVESLCDLFSGRGDLAGLVDGRQEVTRADCQGGGGGGGGHGFTFNGCTNGTRAMDGAAGAGGWVLCHASILVHGFSAGQLFFVVSAPGTRRVHGAARCLGLHSANAVRARINNIKRVNSVSFYCEYIFIFVLLDFLSVM